MRVVDFFGMEISIWAQQRISAVVAVYIMRINVLFFSRFLISAGILS